MNAFVYLLRCSDGRYYVGSARGKTLDKRLGDHQAGTYAGYTSRRRPVTLVCAETFGHVTDAVTAERRIKGWSRAKKETLIRGDWDAVQVLAKRPAARGPPNHPPHPEAAQRSVALEGALQGSRGRLEGSFEARRRGHLRMRSRMGSGGLG